MDQTLRNRIYAIAGAVGLIAATLGYITPEQQDTGLGLIDQGLTLVGSLITLASTALAFTKSLPGRTATLDLPRDQVEAVYTPGGTVLAGPASPLPDGTVLS